MPVCSTSQYLSMAGLQTKGTDCSTSFLQAGVTSSACWPRQCSCDLAVPQCFLRSAPQVWGAPPPRPQRLRWRAGSSSSWNGRPMSCSMSITSGSGPPNGESGPSSSTTRGPGKSPCNISIGTGRSFDARPSKTISAPPGLPPIIIIIGDSSIMTSSPPLPPNGPPFTGVRRFAPCGTRRPPLSMLPNMPSRAWSSWFSRPFRLPLGRAPTDRPAPAPPGPRPSALTRSGGSGPLAAPDPTGPKSTSIISPSCMAFCPPTACSPPSNSAAARSSDDVGAGRRAITNSEEGEVIVATV
mmetsp:Transcript_2072/g.6052  ORF Transcript_2072/g.6052 Transcript_2072/m.6052 type:complete len:297 (+) Transcript_2072:508-1398(+)